MKVIRWNYEKNKLLVKDRGVSFEEVLLAMEKGFILDDYVHPNKDK